MTDHAHDSHSRTGHVVHPMILIGTLVALLILTVATVAITWIDLGAFAIWAAMIVATIKATLVVLFFMHVWWDKPIIPIVLVTSLLLVALFVGLSLIDTTHWIPAQIPGYAPGIESHTTP